MLIIFLQTPILFKAWTLSVATTMDSSRFGINGYKEVIDINQSNKQLPNHQM